MKNLLITTLIISLLIGSWLIFDNYSHEESYELSSFLEDKIIPLTEDEEWEEVDTLYDQFEQQWKSYKKVALAFLENDLISELDLCIARAEKYIEAKDASNSAGELCSIAKQLKLMDKREKITLSNIL